jgi:hypothetical protein
MRCVENSRSHQLALAHGWTWWARTEFEGPAAAQPAILLTRTLNDRNEHLGPRRSLVHADAPDRLVCGADPLALKAAQSAATIKSFSVNLARLNALAPENA